MRNLKIGCLIAGILTIAIVVITGFVYARFQRDIRAAQERLQIIVT